MSIKIEIDHFSQDKREHQDVVKREEPDFVGIQPDFESIYDERDEHDYENLIVIGNGGSITSFRAYLYAFLRETDVDVRLVTTMDPDYLNTLSRELDPDETLVMPVSNSGDTVGVVESLLYFVERGFQVCAVTSDNDGALKQIVEKRDYSWIEHRDVGGRFSGLTETALAPAAFAGIEVEEIREGGEQMYEKLSPQRQYNPAMNVASTLFGAEEEGYSEVFTPFYSTRLFGFYPLTVQLMHETVCKQGEGQTFYGDLGPECQHHTNQRIFGGRKDVVTMFVRSNAHEKEKLSVPEELGEVDIREEKLSGLRDQELSHSLESEYMGVKEALDEEDMPNITLNLTDVSHRNLGRFVAFLHYLAVYSAWFRDVDPFTQPDVEKSKKRGFEQRF
ncbi:MAG: hypothetical protein ABEJ56_01175 [Candidatus Nanohaloarchaea archaeon]